MKTVGLTYDLKTDYEFKKDDPPDANAEFDHPSTIEVIASAIQACGFKVKKIGNVVSLLEKIDSLDVDIVFVKHFLFYGKFNWPLFSDGEIDK